MYYLCLKRHEIKPTLTENMSLGRSRKEVAKNIQKSYKYVQYA